MTRPSRDGGAIRLGLCCVFLEAPIRFRTTTAAVCSRLPKRQALEKLGGLCLENALALERAIVYCAEHGIGAFRIGSGFFPLKTHPGLKYDLDDVPQAEAITEACRRCRDLARLQDVRLTFHPDQFVLLGSPRPDVTRASVAEIEYQAAVAEQVGADVINIHGGGGYGDKAAALGRVQRALADLSERARRRLTFENDDRVFTPSDLLPLCHATGVPLVYDVHHHRCHPDGSSIAETTTAALATWTREPLFHLSSPLGGWQSEQPRRHSDTIRIADFPDEWSALKVTIDIEAKAKEKAVARLRRTLVRRGIRVTHTDSIPRGCPGRQSPDRPRRARGVRPQ